MAYIRVENNGKPHSRGLIMGSKRHSALVHTVVAWVGMFESLIHQVNLGAGEVT